MRTRDLKPGFFRDLELSELPHVTRLLFAGLWCFADRRGRCLDIPKLIKSDIFPYENVPVEKHLKLLDEHGFIERYQVDGVRYIWIPNFRRHQHPHPNEQESVIPPSPHDDDPWSGSKEHQGTSEGAPRSSPNPASTLSLLASEPSLPSSDLASEPSSHGAEPQGLALAAHEYDPDWEELRPDVQSLLGLQAGHIVLEMRQYLELVGLEWFRLALKETREKANHPSWKFTKACLDTALAEARPPGPRPKRGPKAPPGSARAQFLERQAAATAR